MSRGRGSGMRGSGGQRGMHDRVRSAKGRKVSSTRWLERQINDPYVAAAKRQGYHSRAAFKLAELDKKFRFLKPGLRVVDLGAAPGGWTQAAVERVAGGRAGPGDQTAGPRVLAVDLTEMPALPGAEVLRLDVTAEGAAASILAALGGPVDVVLSDMASPATGHRETDHIRVVALCQTAAGIAESCLAPGGTFVVKVYQGGAEAELLARLKRLFRTVRHAKPKASRKESAEMYLVAQGFKGRETP